MTRVGSDDRQAKQEHVCAEVRQRRLKSLSITNSFWWDKGGLMAQCSSSSFAGEAASGFCRMPYFRIRGNHCFQTLLCCSLQSLAETESASLTAPSTPPRRPIPCAQSSADPASHYRIFPQASSLPPPHDHATLLSRILMSPLAPDICDLSTDSAHVATNQWTSHQLPPHTYLDTLRESEAEF